MQRIEGDGCYPPGYFSEGDPTIPRMPTQITAAWMNQVQEEIVGLIIEAGETPGLGVQLPQHVALKGVGANILAKWYFRQALDSQACEVVGKEAPAATLWGSVGQAALEAYGKPTGTALNVTGGTSYFFSDEDDAQTLVVGNNGKGAALEVRGPLINPCVPRARGVLTWNHSTNLTVGPGSIGINGARGDSSGDVYLDLSPKPPDGALVMLLGTGRIVSGVPKVVTVIQTPGTVTDPTALLLWDLSGPTANNPTFGQQILTSYTTGAINIFAFW